MESVGRLAWGVAHDFNNMLGVILGRTEIALAFDDATGRYASHLREIQKAARRSADLTRQLLAFARKELISPHILDLNENVEGMLKMLRRLMGEDINSIWRPDASSLRVKLDPSQLDQILANLCVNARDAIAGTGVVTLRTGAALFEEGRCPPDVVPGEYALLSVGDDGCGMDEETLQKAFEPFFTTKEQGRGTGLGLATVYGIVKQNGGFIDVHSRPDEGTTFSIYFPRCADPAGQPAEMAPANAVTGGNETVLLVEDETANLEIVTAMLRGLGYTVIPASTPVEAIARAKEHAGKIDLLLTDVIMPQMNGRDLAQIVLGHCPQAGLLFMSGYTADVMARGGVADAELPFIQKPFSLTELAEKVREAMESGQ
jgi:CheY-like chemotaxis protein